MVCGSVGQSVAVSETPPEFSYWATTDRGWVSGNTSGYKVWARMFSTVIPVVGKKSTPLIIHEVHMTLIIIRQELQNHSKVFLNISHELIPTFH